MNEKVENIAEDCEVETIVAHDLEVREDLCDDDKWTFPKPRYYLATVLPHSGALRPLSPTLKEHSPESVFPGLAMLREGPDTDREWRNTIEFVAFFISTIKKNLFDSRHHWDMRTKFLEVRLRCMDKIVEDPTAYSKPVEGFLIRVPFSVKKATKESDRKMAIVYSRDNVEKQTTYSDNYVKANIHNNKGNCTDNEFTEKNVPRHERGVIKNHFMEPCYTQNELSISVKSIVENESSFDEKLHCKSLQKGINVGSCRNSVTSSNLPDGSVEYKQYSGRPSPSTATTESRHFVSNSECEAGCLQDLMVVGKAIDCPTTDDDAERVSGPKTEATSSLAKGELVLEDINDKDLVPDVILPSSHKLMHPPVLAGNESMIVMTTLSHISSDFKQGKRLSRLQRFSRTLRTLFSCFRKNQIRPV